VPRTVHIPTDLLLALDRRRFNALEEIFRFHGVYSNAKLKRDVPEFRCAMPYEEGVRRTVAYMDQHKKIAPFTSDPQEDHLVELWDRLTGEMAKFYLANP
jgi:hypothetical protein